MKESNNTIVRVTNEECIEKIENIKNAEEGARMSKEDLKRSLIESIENALNLLKKI